MSKISFIDLKTQQARVSARIGEHFGAVLEKCDFIGGAFVADLEARLADRAGAACVTCASGTDALVLALMALDLQPGDHVVCPSYTFAATAEAVALLGAIPVFVDVDAVTLNIDVAATAQAIAAHEGHVKGVIAVDIFGQPADYAALGDLTARHGLWLIADAAQSFGARTAAGPVGSLAAITTTSFYPAKPLGCYGDGGALFTADAALAQRLRSLRNHGQAQQRYLYDAVGLCSRLDTLQAGVLLAKLDIFDDELAARQRVADHYATQLGDLLAVPRLAPGNRSTWAQYTVALPAGAGETLAELAQRRDRTVARLAARGVPAQVYYAPAMHRQPPYRDFPHGAMDVTERLSASTFSLPMHAYLDGEALGTIVHFVREACDDSAPAV